MDERLRSLREHATNYARMGWAVLPVWWAIDGVCACGDPHDGTANPKLRPKDRGKHPACEGGANGASRDPAVVAAWWQDRPYNIGINPGDSGLHVVDVDGPGGYESLAALEAQHGKLSTPYVVTSGRDGGGEHRYFTVPAPLPGRALGLHIDTRGKSGYVIAPPSIHPTGRLYVWREWKATHAPPVLPGWVTERLVDGGDKHVIGDEPATEIDLDEIPTALRDRLADKPVTPGRSEMIYRFACDCVRSGLDNPTTLALILRYPPAIDKGDTLRHARLALAAAIKKGARPQPVQPDGNRGPAVAVQSDAGNAARLVAMFGQDYRYVPTWGRWLRWDGKRWTHDEHNQIIEAAKEVAATMLIEAAGITDADQRKTVARWAVQTAGRHRLEAMVALARSVPGMSVSVPQLDADTMALNVANGTIDLRTGTLRPHDRAELITKLAPVDYEPAAWGPRWTRFLERILPDEDVREFAQRAIGYSATGDVSEHKLLIPYGSGANGKSVFLETVGKVLGDYATAADPELLLDQRDQHPTGIARLIGARFVVAAESDEGRKLAEGRVKWLTGGDRLSARFMHQDFFEFNPTHTVWLVTNHRPDVRGTDHGLWRRLRIVPFTVTIPEEERDRQLGAKLLDEGPGILAWIVEGARRWHLEGGLTEPPAVVMATEAYKMDNDIVGEFVNDSCKVGGDQSARASDVYGAFTDWCKASGEDAQSQKWLGARLTEKGFTRQRMGSGGGSKAWFWIGLRVIREYEKDMAS